MAPLPKSWHITRIRSIFDKTNDITRLRGEQWYQREHDYALWLARRTGHPPRMVCACLAVLSPRCQWPRVKGACAQLLSGSTPAGIFARNLAKAQEILARGSAVPIDPRTAPKTWSFWRNLWRPNDPEPVTLDSWMFRAHALPPGSGIRAYRVLAEAYRTVAQELGIVPNQLQATIWLHVKRR